MSPAPKLIPPFTAETARQKVRLAENAWNTRDPEKVAMAYTPDSQWRNRAEFFSGRDAIRAFLRRKWIKELDYRLIKELWAFEAERIAVRFQYEWHDDTGQWFRAYGNELWAFDAEGLMKQRQASINDIPIPATDRHFFWDAPGPRPPGPDGVGPVIALNQPETLLERRWACVLPFRLYHCMKLSASSSLAGAC